MKRYSEMEHNEPASPNHQDDDDDDHGDQPRIEWRNYITNKRLKLNENCEQRRKFLKQLRQRAIDVQKRTGKLPVSLTRSSNRFNTQDMPIAKPEWQTNTTEHAKFESIDHIVDDYLNRFYFQEEDVELSKLFKGVCIYVNGYTNPVASVLHQFMLFTGGCYTLTFDGTRTTHTIASQLSSAQACNPRIRGSTVRPEWIIHSIQAKRLLPLDDYLIYKDNNNTIRNMLIRAQQTNNVAITKKHSDPGTSGQQENQESKDNGQIDVQTEDNDEIDAGHCPPAECNNPSPEPNDQPQLEEQSAQQIQSELPTTSKTDCHRQTQPTFHRPDTNKQVTSKKRASSRAANKHKPGNKASDKSSAGQLRIDTMFKREMSRWNNPRHRALDIYHGRKGLRQANICGKTRLRDIEQLIQEWIIEYNKLTDADLAYVLRYMLALVDQAQFTHLSHVLTSIKSCILMIDNQEHAEQWKIMFSQTFKQILCDEPGIPEGLFNEHLFTF